MQKCPNCNYEIKTRYIMASSNPGNLKCSKCKKKLVLTKKSMIIFSLVAVIPMFLAVSFMNNIILFIVVLITWLIIALKILRPIMYRYELEK